MSYLVGKVERRASKSWMNEGSGRMSERRMREQLRKTEERTENKHIQGQEGI